MTGHFASSYVEYLRNGKAEVDARDEMGVGLFMSKGSFRDSLDSPSTFSVKGF